VDALEHAHMDVVPTAVHRGPWLHAHVARATGDGLVLYHLEPAHRAPSMQPRVMQPHLVDEEPLLVTKVALDEQLPSEVVVARQRPEIAGGAGRGVVEVNHGSLPLLEHGRAADACGCSHAHGGSLPRVARRAEDGGTAQRGCADLDPLLRVTPDHRV